jgi:hypothetical protein
MTTATTPRRWGVALALIVAGALGAALTLSALADPSSSPEPGGEPTATMTPSPGAQPSSGPTGTPAPGSLEVVQAGERRTAKPVPITSVAAFQSGLTLRVRRAVPVRGVARGPGEIAGPAVRLELELENGSDEQISLESVVVALTYGAEQTPAVTLSGPDAEPFGGTLEPGAVARGRYVFGVPVEDRGRVLVVASYTGPVPAVALTGSVR